MNKPRAATDWRSDAAGAIYTLTQGTCLAKVWYSTANHWSGSVRRGGVSLGQHHCRTLQDAQAWCAARLAAFIADGHCGADAGMPPL